MRIIISALLHPLSDRGCDETRQGMDPDGQVIGLPLRSSKNLGLHLSIDESMYCGVLYTFVSNKNAHGGQGAVTAIIRGVKAKTVLKWLRKLPEDARSKVIDISMDFSESMKLIARSAFPNARISIDRFHVMQDLTEHLMALFAEVRKKVNIQLKHERAAWYKIVEQHAKRRKKHREKNKKKRRKGRKPSTSRRSSESCTGARRTMNC